MLTQYCYECLQVNGTEIGWSLGFMIDSSSELPQSKREYYMTNLAFALMMTLFILFILISVGFACHAVKFQQRKQKGKLYQTAPKSDGYGAIQWTSKFRTENVQWDVSSKFRHFCKIMFSEILITSRSCICQKLNLLKLYHSKPVNNESGHNMVQQFVYNV